MIFLSPAVGVWAQCNYTFSIAGTPVRCFGESNGTAKLTITPKGADTSPYEIQWFDGYDQDFRSDLPAGTHFVKVTDCYGCATTEFITIDQPRLLTTSLSATHVQCHGEPQGSIDLTVEGGTTPYTYQWSNGEITEDVSMLTADIYSIRVLDFNGCEAIDGVTIREPEKLRIVPSITAVSCNGGEDGSVRVTAFGGVQPYRYDWSNGVTIPDVFNLSAGGHDITITDANNCVLIETIVVPQPPPLGVTFDVKKASCFDLPDGEIVAHVTGGTPDYRYSWSNSSFVLGDTTANPVNLYRDDYTLQVTDANGCTLRDRVRVEEPNPLVINLEAEDATCFSKPDGIIDLSVSGGTTPYSVLWSTDDRSEDLLGLPAGQYQVVVVDALGCSRFGEIRVGQPDSLDFRVTVTAVSCKDETDGRIAIRPKGGTPGYSVLWSNGETALTIDELRGATYSVVLTDAQSCKYEAEFEVPVTPEACITPVGVPNTFTPNGDDYNDLWVINHYEEYPEMEVAVFDRWGQRVFYSKGYEKPWDGTYQNQIVPPGVYYYTIKLNNGDAPFTGTLTIIR